VELWDHVGFGAAELVEQQVAEEVVVAVPLTGGVEGLQEEVRALQFLEQAVRADRVDDGVAQRARQPVEDRRVQEEAPNVFGLTVEYLGAQIVDDVAVVAGERRDEAAAVGTVLE